MGGEDVGGLADQGEPGRDRARHGQAPHRYETTWPVDAHRSEHRLGLVLDRPGEGVVVEGGETLGRALAHHPDETGPVSAR